MIVRILGEGQYDVADARAGPAQRARRGRRGGGRGRRRGVFAAALAALLDGVRTVGVAHAADTLDESDLILPPADATIDEVRELLTDDGSSRAERPRGPRARLGDGGHWRHGTFSVRRATPG